MRTLESTSIIVNGSSIQGFLGSQLKRLIQQLQQLRVGIASFASRLNRQHDLQALGEFHPLQRLKNSLLINGFNRLCHLVPLRLRDLSLVVQRNLTLVQRKEVYAA